VGRRNVGVATQFAGVLFGDARLRSVAVQDETVHERVRRLRERKKLSQAELAAATGDVVTESWLQKFENAHRPKYPTREQLAPLVLPLGTTLAYLMAPMGVSPIEEASSPGDWVLRMRGDPDLTEEAKDALEELTRQLRAVKER
jgi:transcriptional regulator with XRE-family HTH domain